MTTPNHPHDRITRAVRDKYGALAKQQLEKPAQVSCCGGGNCCDSSFSDISVNLYAAEQLANLPESVTGISLGCGNPAAIADLLPGQTVLDLGSGGGIDCFLAADKVGSSGRVVGLDMTSAMLDLARANAKRLGLHNVEFQYGYIEDIPLPDACVDVILSNCVINLSADKASVFREAYRVLKPGGVLDLSDIITSGDLSPALRQNLSAWAGCISGALDEQHYLQLIREAGFATIEVIKYDFYPA